VMHMHPCKCGRAERQTLKTTAAAKTETEISCYCTQQDVIAICRKKHEQALKEDNVRHAAHVSNVTTHILTAFPVLMGHLNPHAR